MLGRQTERSMKGALATLTFLASAVWTEQVKAQARVKVLGFRFHEFCSLSARKVKMTQSRVR